MKKKRRWGLWITLLIVSLIVIYVYLKGFTLLLLPKGELIATSDSPDNTYTLNVYLVNAGGATGGFAIRGELLHNKKGTHKNIYWQYREEKAKVEWIGESNLIINGKKLNVEQYIYDYKYDEKQ
ncbi:hypothetical protein PDENDC454_10730 [Paenibacillus dendritiformis C454]|uniref:DUF5412 domain-containing protein n=1 Tax=Paenibacillus dendritiformis C454 TaxID=1131935 RepID=H3SF41_9BACL|nr:DUF5412 domain-containing protein [Paenibacillus dendritiformis]EHQ62360.1 hypothetical protein PDENDC454_10730 [Paenibacillus dendritiformis C454]